jgi:hypothetical protein
LLLVAFGAAGAWWYGDRFPAVATQVAAKAAGSVAKAAEEAGARLSVADSVRTATEALRHWTPLAANAPQRGRALARLARRGGPAYVSLDGDSLAAALGPALVAVLPADATHPAVAVQGERLYLRGVVDRRALMGTGRLRSLLGGMVEGRDTLLLDGDLALLRPGVARYRVRRVQLGRMAIPDPLRPALLARLRRAEEDTVAGLAVPDDSLPDDLVTVPVPPAVADVRITDGRVVFYRAVPR